MSSFENSPNLAYSSNKRKNIPDGLWNRCEVCGEITFSKELDRNFKICPKCGYHYPMSASDRIRMLIASKSFIEYKSSIPKAEFAVVKPRRDLTSRSRDAVVESHRDSTTATSTSSILNDCISATGVGERSDCFASSQQGKAVGERSEHICEGGLRSNSTLTPLLTPGSSKAGKGLSNEQTDVTSELVTAGEARLHEYQIVLCIISSNPTNGSNIQFNLKKKEYEKILYTFNKSLMKSLPLITFYADGTIVNLSSKYAKPICEGGYIESNNHKTKPLVSEANNKPPRSDGILVGKPLVNEVNTTPKDEIYNSEWLSFVFLINLAAIVEKLSQKCIPHITVLTNPRVGGEFSTSFPLGDIVLAEPEPVNLKSTDNRKNNVMTKNVSLLQLSPKNYLIDRFVNRRDLKKNLMKILSFCIG